MDAVPQATDRRLLLSRLTSNRQWPRLLEAAKDELAQNPEAAHAHRYAAQALINLRRHAEASPHLERVLERNPNDDFSHRLLSIVHFNSKRYREADASIQHAISLNPHDAHHWWHLASMCYNQKDLESARKWVTKARELAPSDPDIINLQALCVTDANQEAALLRESLALDPENAIVHNNLGAHYLNAEKDYSRAEECFRRALTLAPSLKVARRNLFQTIKHRDRIYRVLRAPLDFFLTIRSTLLGRSSKNAPVAILGVIAWLLLFRFVLGGIVLWITFVWPMLKAYEFLVVGDIRSKAGEVGARRGGLLGYRKWPLHGRLALFAILLIGFWAGLYFLCADTFTRPEKAAPSHPLILSYIPIALILVLVGFLGRNLFKQYQARYHAWRRNRSLRHLKSKIS